MPPAGPVSMNRLLLALPLLLATTLVAQGGTPAPSQGIAPRVESKDELQTLFNVYRHAHGGEAAFQGLRDLGFRLVPLGLVDGEEVAEPSLQVDIQYGVEERQVRIEEQVDGKQLVKLSDGLTGRVWVDGQPVEVPELIAGAREEALLFFAYFDLLYGLEAPDIAHKLEGVKTREGQQYLTVHVEFHASRQVYSAFRLYFNSETALIDRIDVFDLRTLKRLYTVKLSEYKDLGGLKFPGRFAFVSVEGQPLKAWRLEAPAHNRGLAPEHFQGL
jgi:hypothetical protein